MKKRVLFFLLLVGLQNIFCSSAQEMNLNIVYIGNSISQGVLIDQPELNAPPVKASLFLEQMPLVGNVRYSNQGVSGKTTVDFLPAQNSYFAKVKAAADQFKEDSNALLLFSIMLGTNDSAIKGPYGAPVSSEQYYTNLQVIIDELLNLYPKSKIILHYPIWYSPNTYNNSMYLKEGLERLKSYFPQLHLLAERKPKNVFIGDTEAFEFFKENYDTVFVPEDGNAGVFYLHPNLTGAARLGEFWGKAIYRIIEKR
ncbi:GDSL-type esterase/lipase family protein [Parabacteroides sp. PF5-9]|uniref:GDSL-type esterase/lipase family protein n=1 Tax=Parabacteroides sp. PF5-9 TaxID=1742404 RepID=UPI00247309EE|nr:GDSL-type esterase/lipase family protein [Parabacteroides sp. PF5-9]MDH6358422.1 lysophospholipase L1-like esterase [Parabacteroides sp. PF5-9]